MDRGDLVDTISDVLVLLRLGGRSSAARRHIALAVAAMDRLWESHRRTSVLNVIPSRDDVAESTAATEAGMYPQLVPVNVYEATGALVVVAPFPAVKADDVRVEIHRGEPATLRFWAHVRSAPPRDFLVYEWEYGGYERELELPAGFGGGVEATLNNGQLAVRVLRGDATDMSIRPSVLR